MQKKCVNFQGFRLPLLGLAPVAALFLSACTTADPLAPQSSLSREKAIAMAQGTADMMGGRVFTIAATGSMKPTLDENSVVAIETVPYSQLRQGDIVIYRSADGVPVVHRLYEQANGRWIVLGDNNSSVDRETVTPTNLVGRVCAIFYTSPGAHSAGPTAVAQR
jgi:signal peptidase I